MLFLEHSKSCFKEIIKKIGDSNMTHDLQDERSEKMNGKGGPLAALISMRGEILSGYMYPKLHRCLRRVERFRKRKNIL